MLNYVILISRFNIISSTNFRVWSDSARLIDSVNYNRRVARPKVNPPNGTSYKFKLNMWFKDTNGCINTHTATQVINGNPVIQLVDAKYCQDKGEALMDYSVKRPIFPVPTNLAKLTWVCKSTPSGVDPTSVLEDLGVNNSWKFKFGAPADDYYKGDYQFSLTVKFLVTGCQTTDTTGKIEIIGEPVVTHTDPLPRCAYGDTMDMNDYFKVDGLRPGAGISYKFVPTSGGRQDTSAVNALLKDGKIKLTKFMVGSWTLELSTKNQMGCTKVDEILFTINPLSDFTLIPVPNQCSNNPPLDLNTFIKPNPGVGTPNWKGTFVSSSGIFTPQIDGTAELTTNYKQKVSFTNQFGCVSDTAIFVRIRNKPNIVINTTKPADICAGDKINLAATMQYNTNNSWSVITPSSGTFDNPVLLNTQFTASASDIAAKKANVKIQTLPIANDVCPIAEDSILINIHPYPIFDILGSSSGCAPHTVNGFSANEKTGIPNNQLKYEWDLGNGNTDNSATPSNIIYPKQGKYTVRLKLTNQVNATLGCATTVDSIAFIKVFPIPSAQFNTDPSYKTSIALPKFKMLNNSTLNTSVFTTDTMQYSWNFNNYSTDPNDQATIKNPVHFYGKDTGRYIIRLKIRSSYGCEDSISKQVLIEPDIIVFIPNAYSPDGAGPNENNTFIISAQNYKNFIFRIYNRWGEKLFETTDIKKGWDGKLNGQECADGVYVYKLDIWGLDDKKYQFNGTVTLIR